MDAFLRPAVLTDPEGFAWIEIDGRTLTGAFYDSDGVEEFTTTITKP